MKSIEKLIDISLFITEDFHENELQEIKGGLTNNQESNPINTGIGCDCSGPINTGIGCGC